MLQQTLGEKVVIEENGKKLTVTNLEATIRRLVSNAAAGDINAFRALSALTLSAENPAMPETSADLAEQDRKVLEGLAQLTEKEYPATHRPSLETGTPVCMQRLCAAGGGSACGAEIWQAFPE